MKITEIAIDRRVSVFVALFLICVVGAYSYAVLPRESAPEVVVPYVIVSTSYRGVAPEDMESLVTVPIERKLTGISGVKEMTSDSVEGMSSIVIEFEPDIVIEDALQRVRDKVDMAKSDLPADADDPVVSEINISEQPILVMCITGDYPLAMLNELAEQLEDRIEAVRGVLDVAVIGGVEREIQIDVDPKRIVQYGVTLAELAAVTQMENVNTPAGSMDLGEAKYMMRTPGEFKKPEDIEGLIVKQGPNGVIYLRDIATVRDGFKDATSISRVDRKPSVTVTVSKRAGENIITIADEVNVMLEQIKATLPPGVGIAMTWDESVWIRDMVADLENSILSGLVLVVGVVLIFMGLTNALAVSLAIPISMLITFGSLMMMGVTLNMVVLFSLILALGMLVDNGIVVVENIYRHVTVLGEDKITAAKRGAAEVAWPIIGSTLTTVAAFFPMFFWPGIMGDFMSYLPLTVCIGLMGSLFVGLIVNPALASVYMRHGKPLAEDDPRRRRAFIIRWYEKALRLALAWRMVTITLAVALLVSITAIWLLDARMEFMPKTEPPQADIDIECPEGTNLATSDLFVKQVEAAVGDQSEYMDHVIANVGSQGVDMSGGGGGGNATHVSRVSLDFPKLVTAKVMPSHIIEVIRERIAGITGASVRINEMEMGPPTGPPVNIEISGDDYLTLARLAEQVKQVIAEVPGVVDLKDDYNKGKPEIRVIVDRQMAWRTGLSTQAIGYIVQTAIDGTKAGEFREGDEEYDVTIRFPKEFRQDLKNLEDLKLINLTGNEIPLSSVATLEQGAGLGSVKRIDRRRTITVSSDVDADNGFNAQQVLSEVQKILGEKMTFPAGYIVSYTGENEDSAESQDFLMKAFFVALLLVGLVLVAQFNSVLQTFIIMSSVILSLTGVFLGLLITGRPFGVIMTGIGVISLAGVVVNNAIVLIDFVNNRYAEGVPLTEAIVEAGITRFRPVMLTAITTVLGLIPMAMGWSVDFRALFAGDMHKVFVMGGESSMWWAPMAIAVIYGLSFATILTLIVVPVLYSLVETVRNLFHKHALGVEL